jgi:hypothetical protein
MFESVRRKRVLLVAVCAVAAVAAILAIVLVVGGNKSTAANEGKRVAVRPTDSAAGSAVRGSGEAVAPVVAAPQGSGTSPPAADAAVAVAACSVDLTTTPPGAQVARDDGTPLGTTPGTFDLPCGTDTKLVVRKQAYFTIAKVVIATDAHTPLAFALTRALFSVKVTSVPPGATITVGTKTLGVTPTTVKLPAFQAATITLAKDGFAPDTQKLTIKQNNMAHVVTLRRQPRR